MAFAGFVDLVVLGLGLWLILAALVLGESLGAAGLVGGCGLVTVLVCCNVVCGVGVCCIGLAIWVCLLGLKGLCWLGLVNSVVTSVLWILVDVGCSVIRFVRFWVLIVIFGFCLYCGCLMFKLAGLFVV